MVFLPLPESWDVHLAQNHARTLDPEGGTESRKDCPRKESMKITGSGSSHPGGLLAFPFTGCQHWARRFTFLCFLIYKMSYTGKAFGSCLDLVRAQ